MLSRRWLRETLLKYRFVGFAVLFTAMGVAALVLTKAAPSNTASFEPEKGTRSSCATVATDNSASDGAAVKFGCTAPADPLGLDPSGLTIPAVYPVPATGVIYMATTGNDANAGTTEATPVKTLTRAIAAVPVGGTIVARAGVYRDSDMPIVSGKIVLSSKVFNLQSYPNEQVWFDGTDSVPSSSWTNEGNGRWSVAWDTPNFCQHYKNYPAGGYYSQIWPWLGTSQDAGPCIYADMVKDPNVDADPQMVFVNDSNLTQARSMNSVTSTSFYNDVTAKRIYIGIDPVGKKLEITKRPMAFGLQGGAGGNMIRGIGFRKFATNQFQGGSYTYGALLINVPNVTIENDVFARNAGGAMQFANAHNAKVNRTVFVNNGYTALGINGTSSQTSPGNNDGSAVTNNIFKSNNAGLFGFNCQQACGQAGAKFAHMDSFTLKNNLFEDQKGVAAGFWCDLNCKNGVIVNNLARNNGGHGLYYEVSMGGTIASNLTYNNGRYGIKVSAANTRIYNNTSVNNAMGGIIVYDDDRYPGAPKSLGGGTGGGVWTDVSPSTTNIDLFNNVLVNNPTAAVVSWRTSSDPNDTGPNTFYSGYNFNSYFRNGTSVPVSNWQDPFKTTVNYATVALLLAAKGKEADGQDITDGSNPFVDMPRGNYTIKDGAIPSGHDLPGDIAQAIGVPVGNKRGALRWYPTGN